MTKNNAVFNGLPLQFTDIHGVISNLHQVDKFRSTPSTITSDQDTGSNKETVLKGRTKDTYPAAIKRSDNDSAEKPAKTTE